MKDLWMLGVLCASLSVANAFDLPTRNPNCPAEDDPFVSVYLSDRDDCATFYICMNGTAYPATCLHGMHWNPSLEICEISEPGFTCPITETHALRSIEDSLCTVDDDPFKLSQIQNSNDCGQFFACIGGLAYPMSCGGGEHWSVELKRCASPSIANCQQRQSRSLIPDGFFNLDCPLDDDPSNPTMLRHPFNCEKFYKCSYGRSYVLSCPFGLHWDVASNRCESAFIANCKNSENTATTTTTLSPPKTPKPSTKSSTTATIRPDPNLPIPIPQCADQNSVQKFGIAGECKLYLQCYQGKILRMKCREGREWSSTINDCIDAAFAGCSSSPGSELLTQTTRSTPMTTTPSPIVPTKCEEGVEFLKHPTNCHKYIQCDNGNPIERECSHSLYFSWKLKRCEWTSSDC